MARIIDKDLLKSYHSKRCIITGTQAEPHHVYHRSQPYGHDHPDNLIPLCRVMHCKLHSIGLKKMAEIHPQVEEWLYDHGWEFNEYNKKWQNLELKKLGEISGD